MDLIKMADQEGKEMLADWADSHWPVNDENMKDVIIRWASDVKGSVDFDPRLLPTGYIRHQK